MASLDPVLPDQNPESLQAKAIDNVRFIRAAMERAGTFTALSGRGAMAVGGTAVVAALIAPRLRDPRQHLALWLGEAVLAIAVGQGSNVLKGRRIGLPVLASPARQFLLGLLPPLVAGALLTWVLSGPGTRGLLAGTWLLLYGVAVVTAGRFSVRLFPIMGLCFMGLGAIALVAPAAWGDGFMGVGFGGLHLLFGFLIARRHGG